MTLLPAPGPPRAVAFVPFPAAPPRPGLARRRAAHVWDREFAGGFAALEDETVAIVGNGGIGQAVARRLLPAAKRLVMFSRSAQPDGPAGQVHPLSALPDLLPECGSVVL